MKKTVYSFAVASLMSIAVASAQDVVTDSVNNTATRSNSLSEDKSRQGMTWRDSVRNSEAVTPGEKNTLDKDYDKVRQDYHENKRLANDQLNNPEYRRDGETLEMYRNDRKEFQEDREALQRQKRRYDRANADGVITDQERAKMEAQYKRDKKHYKKDKKTVEYQKKQAKDPNKR